MSAPIEAVGALLCQRPRYVAYVGRPLPRFGDRHTIYTPMSRKEKIVALGSVLPVHADRGRVETLAPDAAVGFCGVIEAGVVTG